VRDRQPESDRTAVVLHEQDIAVQAELFRETSGDLGEGVTMSTRTNPGAGKERGIAFGGGGEWFTVWTLSYLSTLKENGVDVSNVDITVGTSAGSLAGSFVTAGTFVEANQAFTALAAQPDTLAKMIPTDTGSESQLRAKQCLAGCDSYAPAHIREIGRVAMAARNAPVDGYIKSLEFLLKGIVWPTAHHVTAVDCYTGELLVLDKDCGVDLAPACAASSSLPGTNGPTWIGDRYCMDGGVSHSSTHAEVLAGVKRALIFSMLCTDPDAPSRHSTFGFAERIHPGTAQDEADALTKAGARVSLICANPPDDIDFMDPKELASAIELGAMRGANEAAAVAEIWNS
jgi:NTE family protein